MRHNIWRIHTDWARPIRPSKGTESSEKSVDSVVATPKVWPGRARPATLISSVITSPATCPVPYVTSNCLPVSVNDEEL